MCLPRVCRFAKARLLALCRKSCPEGSGLPDARGKVERAYGRGKPAWHFNFLALQGRYQRFAFRFKDGEITETIGQPNEPICRQELKHSKRGG